jgi:cell wall-associated NlpC family hydrolase
MSGLGAKVAVGDLKPGDLVFFNTRRFQFSHVGIYLGDNRFIHAPTTGSEVEIARLSESYWQKHFNGARRLVGVLPGLVPDVIAPAVAGTMPPVDTTP